MWDLLIVIIIAAVIWFFGSSVHFGDKSSVKMPQGPTNSAVKSLTAPTQKIVDESRRLQQQQMDEMNQNN